ncbi:hypothetical protein B0H14DRAFT_2569481 [Mycena olivaceomarginata]|nr:hypothetical protein B0H14DRAFT_2569481 [Mycena olivaceomarginata]
MPAIVTVCGIHWIGYQPANTAGNPNAWLMVLTAISRCQARPQRGVVDVPIHGSPTKPRRVTTAHTPIFTSARVGILPTAAVDFYADGTKLVVSHYLCLLGSVESSSPHLSTAERPYSIWHARWSLICTDSGVWPTDPQMGMCPGRLQHVSPLSLTVARATAFRPAPPLLALLFRLQQTWRLPAHFRATLPSFVAVYPLVEPGDHEIAGNPTQPLALRNEDLHDYLTRFALHGLLLELNVPRHGLMLAEVFTGQVIAALALKNLILPSSPHLLAPADASQLHKQPYCLLSPIRRHAVFKFSTHPSINANNFGIEEVFAV